MLPNPIGRALRNVHAGHDTLLWARPGLEAPEALELTSPAFADGEPMPERYRGRLLGANISPPLAWTAPPADAAELVLVVQDPDAPMPKPPTHALAVGIEPSPGVLPENGLAHPVRDSGATPGMRFGRAALGRRGWAGPMPPRSHGPHSYVFQLFAVDRPLDLGERFGLGDVVRAMEGHVVARARLVGTFENS